MRRELPGGYELDDDRGRVDVEAVHRYLSEEAYWVRGRDRATIERLVRESTRVIGAYHGQEQVGFARVISDGSSMRGWATCSWSRSTEGAASGWSSSGKAWSIRSIATFPGTSTRATRTSSTHASGSSPRATGPWSGHRGIDQVGGRSSARSTSGGARKGTWTSSIQPGWEAMSARAPKSPWRCPASA
jgi:hypothetical protein